MYNHSAVSWPQAPVSVTHKSSHPLPQPPRHHHNGRLDLAVSKTVLSLLRLAILIRAVLVTILMAIAYTQHS